MHLSTIHNSMKLNGIFHAVGQSKRLSTYFNAKCLVLGKKDGGPYRSLTGLELTLALDVIQILEENLPQ